MFSKIKELFGFSKPIVEVVAEPIVEVAKPAKKAPAKKAPAKK